MFFDKWIKENTPIKFKEKKVSIYDIKLPIKIDYMEREDIKTIVEENLLKTYKSLEYCKKEREELLAIKEWNNWEMSLILKFYKSDLGLRVIEPKTVFPEFIYSVDRFYLRDHIDALLNVYASRDASGHVEARHKKDVYWTALDITYFLYYLFTYKKDENELQSELNTI